MDINWTSLESAVLWNPLLPQHEQKQLDGLSLATKKWDSHIWIATSGTTNRPLKRLIALSKKAFLVSAQAVNEHLNSSSQDVWLNPLPIFHVGGLSIYARAFLSGAKVEPLTDKWDPKKFHDFLFSTLATLTALVPTQLYDLISHKLSAPHFLRGVIIGGGSLSKELYEKGVNLGWPLMPSYGLTECASQVATAKLGDDPLFILPHVDVKTDKQGIIHLKSKSLLTGYLQMENGKPHFYEPLQNEWFKTEDRGEVLADGTLKIKGRMNDVIKVLGELVDLHYLEITLAETALELGIEGFQAVLIPIKDERRGNTIQMFVETYWDDTTIQQVVTHFHKKVSSIEKIEKINKILTFPRNTLGKIMKSNLKESLWEY